VLVDSQPDTSGDYGYDLAHEAMSRGRPPGDTAAPGPRPMSPAPARTDQDQDLEYDEAHDF
jgi:hypothetical protein